VGFYYDLVSPYSYLAHGRVRRIREEIGAQRELSPMLLEEADPWSLISERTNA
jgi:2-hydroxychromene-2-carboxylate isomerase